MWPLLPSSEPKPNAMQLHARDPLQYLKESPGDHRLPVENLGPNLSPKEFWWY